MKITLIKLMPDYHCHPLWQPDSKEYNIDPDDLPLTNDLKAALRAWANTYDTTLNQEYPPDSGFASPAEEEAFEAEGRRLCGKLQEQFGLEYKVVYLSQRDKKWSG